MTDLAGTPDGQRRSRAMDRLRQSIKRLHVQGGEPSTRTIATRTGRAISHSTVHAVLRCSRLPTWGQLELVIEQLGGDSEAFRHLWMDARSEQRGEEAYAFPDDLDRSTMVQRQPVGPVRTEPVVDLLRQLVGDMQAAEGSRRQGIETGFFDLDRLLGGGLKAGQVMLVSGRPSIGKSTFLLTILRSASLRENVPSLLISPDLTKEEVAQRYLSAEARVPLHVLRSGLLAEGDWAKIQTTVDRVAQVPLLVNDSRLMTIDTAIAEAQRATADDNVRLLVIDGIDQLTIDEKDDPPTRPAELSRALKQLAVKTEISIIAVCPLKNGPSIIEGEEFHISGFAELDGLSEHADIVVLIHRDDFYDFESPRAGEVDFIVAKHRNGPLDTLTAAAQLHVSRFVDMATFDPTVPDPPLGPLDSADQSAASGA